MPSTVRITGLPGWQDSTSALIPSMLASESGSGLTCETTTTRRNGDSDASNRSERVRRASSGSASDSVFWGSAVIVGVVPGPRARARARRDVERGNSVGRKHSLSVRQSTRAFARAWRPDPVPARIDGRRRAWAGPSAQRKVADRISGGRTAGPLGSSRCRLRSYNDSISLTVSASISGSGEADSPGSADAGRPHARAWLRRPR